MENSSWIRKMFEEGIRLKKEFGEENVFDLSLGNPVIEPPQKVQDALVQAAKDTSPGLHRYMPNAGFQDVREAISKTLSEECKVALSANDLVMVCGAAGGLNITLKTLLDSGDEVLIFAPYFVEYLFYADNHGGKVVSVKTHDDFTLNFDAGTLTVVDDLICPLRILVSISPIGSTILISYVLSYQLDFVIPGILPLEASSLRAILEILNFL